MLKKIGIQRACALFFLAVAFASLTAWGWKKWPDPLIDYGQEAYVPWRLSCGDVLYKDLAFFKGPLAAYLNAGVFTVFGVSLCALMAVCLVITAGCALCIFFYFEKACGTATGLACAVVFLCFFAFAHLVPAGSYNWICPYSHDLTYGVAFSLLMLLVWSWCLARPGKACFFGAGFLLGLVLLTNVEVSLAALAASAAGLFLAARGLARPAFFKNLGVYFLGLAVPPALCFALLAPAVGPLELVRAMAFGWQGALNGLAAKNPYYHAAMGIDAPWTHALEILRAIAGLGVFGAALALLDWAHNNKRPLFWVLLPVLAVLFIIVQIYRDGIPFLLNEKALPGAALALCMAGIYKCAKDSKQNQDSLGAWRMVLVWAVFSVVLLFKIFLAPSVAGFGFALAMPAAMLLVAAFSWLLPLVSRRLGGTGKVALALAMVVLVFDTAFVLNYSQTRYKYKTWPLGQGQDRIYTYPGRYNLNASGPEIQTVVDYMEKALPRAARFAAMPEGAMFHYLLRRPSQGRFFNFMPMEMILYGENTILKSLQDSPPPYVLLVPKDTQEFGMGLFGSGQGFGDSIMGWLQKNYALAARWPETGDVPDAACILLLERKKGA